MFCHKCLEGRRSGRDMIAMRDWGVMGQVQVVLESVEDDEDTVQARC